ncbi:hypothetical protein [Rubellicoccus peritrichatus]|uniref:Ig-like domain-containing protein n=1 Tax=Rubellicoccus peritrichatus TaxID=3080537 RepID=A0AAQ3LC88_9BACT|nr:hypothetical protein [Puniceicoccus sp. CR14]WOO42995.1 hypothetical protein RZN69_07810 [Puniceicoccus sp. CR14]
MSIFRLFCIFLGLTTAPCWAGYGSILTYFEFGTADIVRDDNRDRVYCSVPSKNSVVILDSNSLEIVKTIYVGSNPAGMDVSSDGTKLYVANNGTNLEGIAVIDLEFFSVSHISTFSNPRDVAVGNGIVFSLEDELRAYSVESGIQLAGSLSTHNGGLHIYGGLIDISPDGNTLYYYNTGLSPSSWYWVDVSSWPGEVIQGGTWGSNGQDMAFSADGQYVTFASGAPYSIRKFLADDPSQSLGQMDTGAYPQAVEFSVDGDYIFAVHTSSHIDVWDANAFVLYREIPTSGELLDLECDRQGEKLFAGSSMSITVYDISTGPADDGPQDGEPKVISGPEGRLRVALGQPFEAEVIVEGEGLIYQWYKDGIAIIGERSTILSLESATADDEGLYHLRVSNLEGLRVISSKFYIDVVVPGEVPRGLDDAVAYSSGYHVSEWFGPFFMPMTSIDTFIYSLDFGWVWLSPEGSTAGVWFWSYELESWLWGSKGTARFFYDTSRSLWLFVESVDGGGAYVFNSVDGSWILIEV